MEFYLEFQKVKKKRKNLRKLTHKGHEVFFLTLSNSKVYSMRIILLRYEGLKMKLHLEQQVVTLLKPLYIFRCTNFKIPCIIFL